MKKVYLSGPITGMEAQAPACFQKAKKEVESLGHHAINPMELPHQHGKTWGEYMREDIKALCDCDAIYMMDGWQNSRGAQVENLVAARLGYEILYQNEHPRHQ